MGCGRLRGEAGRGEGMVTTARRCLGNLSGVKDVAQGSGPHRVSESK